MEFDWSEIFRPDQPFLETVLRGSLTYLGIVAMMRVGLKRQAGSFGLGDLLLIVMIADASQNAMAGTHQSWPNGIVLVATLIGWNYALDWASYRSAKFRSLLEPEPRTLIRDGKALDQNLRREQITEEELCSELRMKGYSDYAQVREARIESGGKLSILPAEGHGSGASIRDGERTAGPGLSERDAALQSFLRAAERLDRVVSWHEQRIEEHREFVKQARQELKRHGVVHPRKPPAGAEPQDASPPNGES